MTRKGCKEKNREEEKKEQDRERRRSTEVGTISVIS
jgi:hypothetical protein